MRRKALSLILCLVMVFSLLPTFTVPASAVSGDQVAADNIYSHEWENAENGSNGNSGWILHYNTNQTSWGSRQHANVYGSVSITVTDGKFASFSVNISVSPASTNGNNQTSTTYQYSSINVVTQANNVKADLETLLNALIGQYATPNALAAGITDVSTYKNGNFENSSITAQDFYNRIYHYLREGLVALLDNAARLTHTVTWMNGTTELAEDTVNHGETPKYTGTTPTKENCTFAGWADEPDSKSPVTVLPPASADKTYYAIFLDESAGETWIYEPVTKEDGWKTTDDYEDLFYYDSASKQYYAVDTTPGDTYIFTPTSTTSWNSNNVNGTYYAWDIQDQCYYQVKKSNGTIYSSAGNSFKISDYFWTGDAQESFGYKDVYGYSNAGNYYFYYDNKMHFVYYNCRGNGIGGGGGDGFDYKSELFFFENSTKAPDGTTFNTESTFDALMGNGVLRLKDGNTFSNRSWNDYSCVKGVYTGATLSSDNYTGTLYQTDGTGCYELYYTRANGDKVSLGKNVIKGEEIYGQALYTRSAETGVVQLSANGENFGNRGYYKGDVLWPGKLYTRHIDVMGKLDGTKKLSSRQNDGNYNLTIDSWATGPYQGYEESEDTPAQPEEKTPLDIVLVMDQSGSMRTPDLEGNTTIVPNIEKEGARTWTLNELRSGTQYYYKDGEKYYPVQLGRGTLYSGTVSVRGNETFGWGNDGISLLVNGAPTYYNVRTNYFIYVDADDDGIKEMHRVRAITAGLDLHYGFYPYIYKDENSTYAQTGKWTDNHYWFRLISPWGANKLRNNTRWDSIIRNDEISFIDTNGNLLGSSDSACNSAKMNYSWVTDTARMKNLYYASRRGYANLYYVDDNGNQQIIGVIAVSALT